MVPKASSLRDEDGDELAPEDREAEEVATVHLLVNAEKKKQKVSYIVGFQSLQLLDLLMTQHENLTFGWSCLKLYVSSVIVPSGTLILKHLG